MAEVCGTYGVTLPEAALAYVRSHPAAISTVIGVRDATQVAETLRRASATVPDGLWPALRVAGTLGRLPPDLGPAPAG
jgi:D-threo-aldose 1-dehydrogenase